MSVEAARQQALDRLKATKERLAKQRNIGTSQPPQQRAGGNKRPFEVTSQSNTASASGSGTASSGASSSGSTRINQHRIASEQEPLKPVSKKFKNYIEYDFSKIKDTKGGFMSEEQDDQSNQLSLEEWQKMQQLKEAPKMLNDPDAPKCFECGTPELDFVFYNAFKIRVCGACRNKFPEKYSLLTKTECKEDYLLTDPEMRDTELLPHLERPNPHKKTYTNMMLYVRFQVEEFAFRKWGGPEGLDAEWEKREKSKKDRKEKKYLAKINEMRKRTRAEQLTRSRRDDRHDHEWVAVESGNPSAANAVSRRCTVCGMTTEELVF